ncbi:MAG TPA: hypothetical protein VES59_11455 [Bacteroidota bacterium]|nr:hypothetical protein [Bacteroidota bacterium]
MRRSSPLNLSDEDLTEIKESISKETKLLSVDTWISVENDLAFMVQFHCKETERGGTVKWYSKRPGDPSGGDTTI